MEIKFVIFDLDGVLVEAKEIHYEALNEALGEKYMITWDEHLSRYDGLKTSQKLEMLTWVHCKNVEAVVYFKECEYDVNYFWHEEDTLTLTSHNHLWVYPGKQPIKNSIAVMPEINNDDVSKCLGICSDKIKEYK